MDAESSANLRAALEPDDAVIATEAFDVWPEHWDTVMAFVASGSQWHVASIGGGFVPSRLIFVGLNYAGVRAGLDAAGFEMTPELWRGLWIMEGAALTALNEVN